MVAIVVVVVAIVVVVVVKTHARPPQAINPTKACAINESVKVNKAVAGFCNCVKTDRSTVGL